MELNVFASEIEEEEDIVEIPVDILNELKTPIKLDGRPDLESSNNIIISERAPEEPKKDNVDAADIRNYYINKSKLYFSDILKYLYKKKFIIILGIIIFIVLLVMYYFFDSWRYMGWKAWFSLVVTMLSVLILIGNMLPPAFVFLGATTICYIFGIINTSEALEGFSNSGVVSVGVLVCFIQFLSGREYLKIQPQGTESPKKKLNQKK
jgi:predicted RND superfamily exporter protein